jgi:anti-sigma factor RsiW
MQKEDFHLSDQDLLLTADGELPTRRAARVRAHLAACWDCRARMAEIETTIADFVRASRQAVDPKIPPIAGPRALLKAQLAELKRTSHHSRSWQLRLAANRRGLAYVFVLALFFALGARILHQQATRHKSGDPRIAYAGALPNPNLTPGSIRPIAFADLCSADHDQVVRSVPGRLQQEVFQEYGLAGAPVADYEVDYLITPGLGGADDILNLWPEPHYNTAWNSYVKDQLEDHLHQMVCGGEVSLAVAQQDIASNWISAYRKYFGTDKPLPVYSVSGDSQTTGLRLTDNLTASTTNLQSGTMLAGDWLEWTAHTRVRRAQIAATSNRSRRQSESIAANAAAECIVIQRLRRLFWVG